jgi:hypothetical protein
MAARSWPVAWIVLSSIAPAQDGPADDGPAPPPAPGRIVAVTLYQGSALVTREVDVPEGEGQAELVVTPLPPRVIDGSVFAEGSDELRVLSTRDRTRAVREDTREEVRSRREAIREATDEIQRLEGEIAVRERNLQLLEKLEGFTGTTLQGLTAQGRLDAQGILGISRFVMDARTEAGAAVVELKRRLRERGEAVEFLNRRLAELASGSGRVERDAVIVVGRARPAVGTVRLSYLVAGAGWQPQYRLKAGGEPEPVRVEYLAAVTQQTGEDWPGVRVTLSTARPSLDAAPPALLPLEMALADHSNVIEVRDGRTRLIAAELEKPIDMPFPQETPLEDVIKYLRGATQSPAFPEGLPIYLDPAGLTEAEKTPASPVTINLRGVPLKQTLRLVLKQLGLRYIVKDGLMRITSETGLGDEPGTGQIEVSLSGGGFGGMGGGGTLAPSRARLDPSGGALVNQEAARDQVEELRVGEGQEPPEAGAPKDGPSVTFAVAGSLTIPSRRDPQLLEVVRFDLPPEFFDKAVPILTPYVYRLAKLTNTSEFVLLPGEASAYVGGEFVGRMRLPLVAVGEPFVVGFGADPQVQVSRRLLSKTRTVQGGNQVFRYEFRIGLRNYRDTPVKVELWDRLPRAMGEAVDVDLVSTTAELSDDALYQRTGRLDNLLRWDLDVPPGTVGERTLYVNYQFRLEYARDLSQPQLASGLVETPIGGGFGGMGGMGGGFRSMPRAPEQPEGVAGP